METRDDTELMSLFWTTAGVFPGDGEISPFDFRDRVEAAAHAGFRGIGIWHTDLEHCMIHRSLKEMKAILDDNDIRYLELEFLTDWFLGDARKGESDSRKQRLLAASEVLGAKHIKVGDFYNCDVSLEQATESFAALCSEAADHGATIGFEIMGCAMIDNLRDALAMVRGAGAPNGGIILDILQVVALGMPYDEIAEIPRSSLVGVELNDGTLPGSPNDDPSRARYYCGEGEYDIRGFVQAVRRTGFDGPWAVEVMSRELTGLPLRVQSNRAFETTMQVFMT